MALIRQNDWLSAFLLANEEMRTGNMQYSEFWFAYLKNGNTLPEGFIFFIEDDTRNVKERTPLQWYLKGLAHFHALGMEKSLQTAQECFEKAAALGEPYAINSLANMFWHGAAGGDADPARARRLFEQAAALGNSCAINNLACMLRYGYGGNADPVEAHRLFEQAIDLGNSFAMHNLAAILFLDNLDYRKARRLFEQAAALGLPYAMNNLAYMLRGEGGEVNHVRARTLYEQAAALGKRCVVAMRGLAGMLKDGQGGPVDLPKAVFLMNNAQLLDDRDGETFSRLYLNNLRESNVNAVLACFWSSLVSGKSRLHHLTAAWLHHKSRQTAVYNWVKENGCYYCSDIQALHAAFSSEDPQDLRFSAAMKRGIRKNILALQKKEIPLLGFFSEKKKNNVLADPNVIPIILRMFDNHPAPGKLPLPVLQDRKRARPQESAELLHSKKIARR